jgi:DNA-binding CsgD family transcriptional regulator
LSDEQTFLSRENLSVGDLARIAAEVLEGIPFPALVLEVPSERIVAASPAAAHLLDPDRDSIVGHLFEEFTSDNPDLGRDIFAGGRLNGFETFRVLRRARGADATVRMWIRQFDEQPSSKFVVAVIVVDVMSANGVAQTDWQETPAVVGTADTSVMIERISSDAESLFKLPVSNILGTSMLALVAQEDMPACLAALEDASANQTGVTLHVRVRTGIEGPALRCEQVILPLQPSPSCAFIFLPRPDGNPAQPVSARLSQLLFRFGRGAEIAHAARTAFRGMTEQTMPGVSRLTTRELEIVSRLLEGERPPAIADRLFLSQSTIRNHLASVYVKLGVGSQQQLLNLFRPQ